MSGNKSSRIIKRYQRGKKRLFTVIVQKINKAPLRGGAADNKQIISVFMEHIVWQAECSQRL